MLKELPVHITPKALENIKRILKSKQVPQGYGLRIGTKNTNSCGATSFMLGFDTQKTSDDNFTVDGIDVFINKKELLFLIDLILDFEEGEISGFKFNK
ncbi:MAG: iron-sulfur cluster assembly accessory protein [Cyclobacteriaceae bacterium]|nr:iron-sulfur cluster assembly accessory protein [Cyclobacteriaceae bacterium]